MYKKFPTDIFVVNGVEVQQNPASVLRVTDGVSIPFDPANTDYQEYLKWLAEGNEPEPAEE